MTTQPQPPKVVQGPEKLRVYVAGSHGVGKTSVARWVSKHYALPLVAEVARQVLAEAELSLQTLRVDIDRTSEFQAQVFRRQAAAEDAVGQRFISDRCCDNLAYAAEHTHALRKIAQDGLDEYAKRLKAPGSVVFLVRPHRSFLEHGDDGVREAADWDAVVRIDGAVRFLLEYLDVDYVSVASPSMADRTRTFRAVLGAMGAKPVTT